MTSKSGSNGASPSDKDELIWMYAFGSNMLSEVLQKSRGVHPVQAIPGRAWGHQFSLHYRGWPFMEPAFATIAPSPWRDVCIWGVAYQITQNEMQMIIQTEGPKYQVIQVEVELEQKADAAASNGNSGVVTAYTLSSKPEQVTSFPAPWSMRYKDLVVRGAKEKHLPDHYVRFLESMPHYRRPLIDVFLMLLVSPILVYMWTAWGLSARLPRPIGKVILKLAMKSSQRLIPLMWFIHDMVPESWRGYGQDLEAKLPAGGPGEWFSGEHRQAETK